MYRFVRAGIHAALLQTGLLITVALVAGVLWHFNPGADASSSGVFSEHRAAIAFVDVLMAALVSMLRTPAITETARQLANGYRRISPRNPKRAAATLGAQLLLASLGLAAIALRSPPEWFRALATLQTGLDLSVFLWPGMISVVSAAFGANTHAAILGSREQ
jgi:hypothetical protein